MPVLLVPRNPQLWGSCWEAVPASLRAQVWFCEAGRELKGRHSTVVKWHFSLHCTYRTQYPPTQPCHAATHPLARPLAQVGQQRIISEPVSEIGACSIGKQSRSGHVTSRVAAPARYQGIGAHCACLWTTTGYPSLSTSRRQPKPSPRILAQTQASLLLLNPPPLAGLASVAGWN